MSDQPKPATDSVAFGPKGLTGIAKPTTGEWTATTVAVILGKDGHYGLAAAHNAALAADRERHGDEMTSVQLQLNKQLAASVHYWQGVATQEWHKGFAASHDEHQQQLAALEQSRSDWTRAAIDAEQQLATAVDYMTVTSKSLRTMGDTKLADSMDAALAKIGGE
jgi:hypothetical protein